MGKAKKTKAPTKILKKSPAVSKKPVKKILESKTEQESPRKKTTSPLKSKKILTAEGWKRLMMGAKKT